MAPPTRQITMSNESRTEEIRDGYLTMTMGDRQRFLAAYAHELTILARGHFADRAWEPAGQCNETIHRIVGHLASSREDSDPLAAGSFIDMLIAGAEARGWSWVLHRTMVRATRPDAQE